jgi:hypothetical protein
MPNVQIGGQNSLDSLVETDESPIITRGESGDTVERIYILNSDVVKTITDSLSWGTSDSVYINALLASAKVVKVAPSRSQVTLIYEPEKLATFERIAAVGTVTQEVDANPIDIPIKKNPNTSSAFVQQDKADGVEAYISPQPTYTRTEILGSFVFSEANAIDNVGKVDLTPEGLSSPSPNKWLKTGFNVRTVGDKFEKTETWQYAENAWDILPDGYYAVVS